MKLAPLTIVSDRQDLEKVENRRRTNEVIGVVNGLGEIVLAGNSGTEPLNADNALWLAQGNHGGYLLAKPRTRIDGAAGASVVEVATHRSTSTVQGVNYTAAVVLEDGAQVFIGCTFRQDNVAQLVAAVAGAKATFIGCTFYGSGLTQVVDNPGVITDIVLLGCHNATGAAAGNVTEIGGV